MHLGIDDPPDPALSRLLRAVVLEHAENEHRRVFDPTLHLAVLTQEGDRTPIHCVLSREDTWDDALRTDVVAALLRRLPPQRATERWLAWLTRTGDLDIQDLDLAALRALRSAAAEAEAADFHFVVVNRRAWRDPVTGVGREWKRLRDRRGGRHNQVP
ncbi:hypothetical protein GCM10027020_09330 [Nocardioides salsibiostraticola]